MSVLPRLELLGSEPHRSVSMGTLNCLHELGRVFSTLQALVVISLQMLLVDSKAV